MPAPDPNGLDAAHQAMREYLPDDRDPARCRSGERHPCYRRENARYMRPVVGRAGRLTPAQEQRANGARRQL